MPESPHNKPLHVWLPWISYNKPPQYLIIQNNSNQVSEQKRKCGELGIGNPQNIQTLL